jgi:hypothetical protein
VDSSALLYEQVVECRVIKSPQEIALMQVNKHIVMYSNVVVVFTQYVLHCNLLCNLCLVDSRLLKVLHCIDCCHWLCNMY